MFRRRVLLAGLILGSTPLGAQETIDMDGEPATVVLSVGQSLVLDAAGPRAYPTDSHEDALKYRWLMVQDSTMRLVFTEPSGIKRAANDTYDGDMDLRPLGPLTATELRAATFNVWGEFTGVISVTSVRYRRADRKFSHNPVWKRLTDPAHTHLTSVLWVHRVKLPDGTVLTANMDAVTEAVSMVAQVPLEALEPTPDRITSIGDLDPQ